MKGGTVSCRGVWIAPWTGDNGEPVIYAIDSSFRLITEPVLIPGGVQMEELADRLWDLLDARDPAHAGILGSAPRWRRTRRRPRPRGNARLQLVK